MLFATPLSVLITERQKAFAFMFAWVMNSKLKWVQVTLVVGSEYSSVPLARRSKTSIFFGQIYIHFYPFCFRMKGSIELWNQFWYHRNYWQKTRTLIWAVVWSWDVQSNVSSKTIWMVSSSLINGQRRMIKRREWINDTKTTCFL